MSETSRPAVEEQPQIGSYFVANYPPFSVWTKEDVERVAGFIRVEIARMERLVDDLLLLASIDEQRAVSRETIEIAPFTEELWQSIRELGERRFELPTVPQGTLSADSDRLTWSRRRPPRWHSLWPPPLASPRRSGAPLWR